MSQKARHERSGYETFLCAPTVQKELQLNIPFTKVMPLAADPVPFLGYLLDHTGYSVLARNIRRFEKHVRVFRRKGCRESRIAQALLAHQAWTSIPQKAMKLGLCKERGESFST